MNIDLDGIVNEGTESASTVSESAKVNEAPKQETSEVKTESKTGSDKKLNSFEKAFEDVPDDLGEESEVEAKTVKTDEKAETDKTEQTEDKPLKILPPAQFNESQKKEFEKLTPQMQAAVSKMAYDMRSELSRQSQFSQPLKPVLDTYQKYAPEYQKAGIGLDKVVTNAIEWDRALSNPNPSARKQAVRAFIQAYEVDPVDLLDDSDSGYQPEQNYQQSQPQLSPEALEQMIEQKLAMKEQAQKQIQFAQSAQSAIQDFVGKNPLFQDANTGSQLEQAMAPYVNAFYVSNPNSAPLQILKQAYNIVVSDDNLPFKALLAQSKTAEQAAKEKGEAEKALNASKSITGGMKGHTRSPATMKGREIWEHHFAGFKF